MHILDAIPVKGETWEHTKSGKRYLVLGSTFNSITDKIDVRYAPCYDCEYAEFNRQMTGHPKAWISKNEDGTPRFKRVVKV